jgi:hypothetical protein
MCTSYCAWAVAMSRAVQREIGIVGANEQTSKRQVFLLVEGLLRFHGGVFGGVTNVSIHSHWYL